MTFNPYESPHTSGSVVLYSSPQESAGLSIASLVLGIISVVLFCVWYISLPCATLAIIFGFIGRGKGGKGMATAGLVLGFVAVGLVAVMILGLVGYGILEVGGRRF